MADVAPKCVNRAVIHNSCPYANAFIVDGTISSGAAVFSNACTAGQYFDSEISISIVWLRHPHLFQVQCGHLSPQSVAYHWLGSDVVVQWAM